MEPIRVLIVDDTVVFRRLVSEALADDPALRVVGTAANGRIALAKIPQTDPDVIILDIEMPEMDGLATLVEVRKNYPRLPVIMFSALTERGAAATLDALALGATDYFTKPSKVAGLDASMRVLREELIPEIKVLCRRAQAVVEQPIKREPMLPVRPVPIEAIAIGASTGGPNALTEVLIPLSERLRIPVFIVQHMPPTFTRLFAERLSSKCACPVREAAGGELVRGGEIWIAPGDLHMAVVRDGPRVRILTHRDPPVNSCRPAADVLFRSVADSYGAAALVVVLTGMGHDGLAGCERIERLGGRILIQDEASSVVWGMPGAVAQSGLRHTVVPLDQMTDAILHQIAESRVVVVG